MLILESPEPCSFLKFLEQMDRPSAVSGASSARQNPFGRGCRLFCPRLWLVRAGVSVPCGLGPRPSHRVVQSGSQHDSRGVSILALAQTRTHLRERLEPRSGSRHGLRGAFGCNRTGHRGRRPHCTRHIKAHDSRTSSLSPGLAISSQCA